MSKLNDLVFKVIIAGPRTFTDYKLLKEEMDILLQNKIAEGYKIVIISGHAKGADSLGERYAKENGYELIVMPANWDKFGKSAGYIRNSEMADIANAAVVFWDEVSKGSKHMIDICVKKKLDHRIIYY